jgi:hypothetical protein
MINRPTGSGDYIFLILQSPAYFILNGKRVETKGCSVIFYKKGTPQIYGALNEEFVNDWIHFELDEGEYEVELYFEGKEYETEVDAFSGKVFDADVDREDKH